MKFRPGDIVEIIKLPTPGGIWKVGEKCRVVGLEEWHKYWRGPLTLKIPLYVESQEKCFRISEKCIRLVPTTWKERFQK